MKVEPSMENFKKYTEMISVIDELFISIKRDTKYDSHHNDILNHKAFGYLVDMGDKIIPYIFHKMTQSGGDWIYFLLLEKIIHFDPVPKKYAGYFIHCMIHWMRWYVNSQYYPIDDIYHGLINE